MQNNNTKEDERRKAAAVEQLLDLARLALNDNNDPEKALGYALNAARISSGENEDKLLKILDVAKARATNQRQAIMNKYGNRMTEEQASKYAAARAVCDDMIQRVSNL